MDKYVEEGGMNNVGEPEASLVGDFLADGEKKNDGVAKTRRIHVELGRKE